MQKEIGRGHTGASRAPDRAQSCAGRSRDRWLRFAPPPANICRPFRDKFANLATTKCMTRSNRSGLTRRSPLFKLLLSIAATELSACEETGVFRG